MTNIASYQQRYSAIPKGSHQQITFRIEPGLWDRIDRAAKLHNIARSTLIRRVMEIAVDNPELCDRAARRRG